MATVDIDLRQQHSGAGATCLKILGSLPEWFGVGAAVQHYAEAADSSHTIVATAEGEDIGFLVVTHHSAYAAEVYVMAVRPEHHRRGVGRRMLALAEATLAAGGTEYLQVKTPSPSHPDEGYARARAFYTSCCFRPLEEFPTLWGPANPALQLVKKLGPPPAPSAPTGVAGIHHVELWVPDLARASASWQWLLSELGYQVCQEWPAGRSWRRDGHYLVFEQSKALVAATHERCRPGLNHLAFHAGRRAEVDRLVGGAAAHGWVLLFAERHPFAGGPGHYAAYLENVDGYEVELVATDEAGGSPAGSSPAP